MIYPAGAMSKQPIDRRDFMKAAGAAFAASLAPQRLFAVEQAEAVFATAYQIKDGPCGVAVLSEDRKLLFTSPLPDRGHDVTYDPVARRSVVFARRPGTFAVVFDHTGAVEPMTITSPPGRHFFGHGVFSPDGRLLYATENDFENAAGMIGIYDATGGFARIGEFPRTAWTRMKCCCSATAARWRSPMAASKRIRISAAPSSTSRP